MAESNRERVLSFPDTQVQLAQFARESYRLDGRGLIQVDIPEPPPGLGGLAMTNMVYHKLDDLRELLNDVGDANRDDADITLRMVEMYNPERQAVVTVAVAGENAISVKLRLEPLTIIESDSVN